MDAVAAYIYELAKWRRTGLDIALRSGGKGAEK
jgi:hypothetical protein